MNEFCPTCSGSGGIEVLDGSIGEVVTIPCPDCGGSGEIGGRRTEGYTNEQFLKAAKYIVENLEKLNKALDDALRAKRKERFEIIKFLRESEKVVAPGMQPSDLISGKDVDWLINRIEGLEEENERYREALKAIAYFDDREEGETATRIDTKYIARKALEGEK